MCRQPLAATNEPEASRISCPSQGGRGGARSCRPGRELRLGRARTVGLVTRRTNQTRPGRPDTYRCDAERCPLHVRPEAGQGCPETWVSIPRLPGRFANREAVRRRRAVPLAKMNPARSNQPGARLGRSTRRPEFRPRTCGAHAEHRPASSKQRSARFPESREQPLAKTNADFGGLVAACRPSAHPTAAGPPSKRGRSEPCRFLLAGGLPARRIGPRRR